jgi:hypothetical protein
MSRRDIETDNSRPQAGGRGHFSVVRVCAVWGTCVRHSQPPMLLSWRLFDVTAAVLPRSFTYDRYRHLVPKVHRSDGL